MAPFWKLARLETRIERGVSPVPGRFAGRRGRSPIPLQKAAAVRGADDSAVLRGTFGRSLSRTERAGVRVAVSGAFSVRAGGWAAETLGGAHTQC